MHHFVETLFVMLLIAGLATGCISFRRSAEATPAETPDSAVDEAEGEIAVDAALILSIHGTVVDRESQSPVSNAGVWYIWPGAVGPQTGIEAKCLAVSDAEGKLDLGRDIYTLFDADGQPPDLLFVLLRPGYVPYFIRIRSRELKGGDVDLGRLVLTRAPENPVALP